MLGKDVFPLQSATAALITVLTWILSGNMETRLPIEAAV